jgi:hypothetical protein
MESGDGWEERAGLDASDLSALRASGVELVMIQQQELGSRRSRALREALTELGAAVIAEDTQRWLLRLP